MTAGDQATLNAALMAIPSRSEKHEQKVMIATFVEAGTLFKRLSSVDNQIIYGRRGTGKTHTLQFLASKKQPPNDFAIYTDLSSLGSASSVYSDASMPLTHRATTLLRDILITIHETVRIEVSRDAERLALHSVAPALNDLLDQINTVEVVGETEFASQQEARHRENDKFNVNLGAKNASVTGSLSYESGSEAEDKVTTSVKQKGAVSYHLRFGGVNTAIRALVDQLPVSRVWILLDEWSSIPFELQPYLADLLRRCLFNISKITVKIAAIEYRSNFRISGQNGMYIGIETGAETTSSVNVDDYLVFENDATKSRTFYINLFARHLKATNILTPYLQNLDDVTLVSLITTQQNAFDELVKAAEGVPRDAINIASQAAQRADDKKLSIPGLKLAARQWFVDVKKTAVDQSELQALLNWIINKVIGQRKARAFLVKSGVRSQELNALFDARVLHIIKRDITYPDAKITDRYDAFKLDYGCYVHLMSTKAIEGANGEREIDVPLDDYRAVRRAVLDIEAFRNRNANSK